ncbi:MAG: hypothetical protein IPG64_01680 [Haliea sp.]|nr:hypothetical protein [Haliea sp.]
MSSTEALVAMSRKLARIAFAVLSKERRTMKNAGMDLRMSIESRGDVLSPHGPSRNHKRHSPSVSIPSLSHHYF